MLFRVAATNNGAPTYLATPNVKPTLVQWIALAVPAIVAGVGAAAPYLKDHPLASVVALVVVAMVNAVGVQALKVNKEAE